MRRRRDGGNRHRGAGATANSDGGTWPECRELGRGCGDAAVVVVLVRIAGF